MVILNKCVKIRTSNRLISAKITWLCITTENVLKNQNFQHITFFYACLCTFYLNIQIKFGHFVPYFITERTSFTSDHFAPFQWPLHPLWFFRFRPPEHLLVFSPPSSLGPCVTLSVSSFDLCLTILHVPHLSAMKAKLLIFFTSAALEASSCWKKGNFKKDVYPRKFWNPQELLWWTED